MRFLLIAAAAAAATPAAANLVVNGDFEAGDFSGWTQFGDPGFTSVTGTFLSVAPFEGSFHARFGPVAPGGIVQDIATVPGASYSLSFALAQKIVPGVANANSIEVRFGDLVLLSATDFAPTPYTVFQFGDLVATSALTELRFTFSNPPDYFLLDDVRLTQVSGVIPEPATWAMLIAGFGLVGGALRRRRTALQP